MNIEKIRSVINECRKYVEPSLEERKYVESRIKYVIDILSDYLRSRNFSDIEVTLQGSFAKDTWLPGNRDVDIFLVIPKKYGLDIINTIVNEVINLCIRNNLTWYLKYAQHPYVVIKLDDIEFDVVPCFKISKGEKPITAADRTPLHTEYVLSKLSPNQRIEVRLLKKFMKVVGVYGAEIKVEGFSGYLAELLIIHYGDFINLLIDVVENWRPGNVVIDLEKYYSDVNLIKKKFKDSVMIVIDPVDSERNVAAAVSLQKFSTFIAACKIFYTNPTMKFFIDIEEPKVDLSSKLLPKYLIMYLKYPKGVVPDIIWGEVKKLTRALANLLKRHEFKVYDYRIWSDDVNNIVITFILEELDLPPYILHEGPPVYSNASIEFINKYLQCSECLGPFIIGSRWYVIKRRKFVSVEDVILKHIMSINVKHLKESIKEMKLFRIMSLEDIKKLPEDIRDVVLKIVYLRPRWLSITTA